MNEPPEREDADELQRKNAEELIDRLRETDPEIAEEVDRDIEESEGGVS